MLTAASEFQRTQQRIAAAVSLAVRRLWGQVDADFDAGWLRIGAKTTALVAAGQLAAAQRADGYMTRVLEETGQPDDPVADLRPRSFAGSAPDGRTLDGLLFGAVTNAKQRVAAGESVPAALQSSGSWLDMTVSTVVFDAARLAVGVATAARPHIGGQVRQLNPPSCSRCAILAGRWYRWDAGFPRHVNCDCIGIPASENVAGDFLTDPSAAVNAGQVRGLSQAEQKAFDEGGDLSQLVNVHRKGGIYTAFGGRKFTREGTTRRGAFRRSVGRNTPRITPEQIYREAGGDRQEAVRLLKRFGYLI